MAKEKGDLPAVFLCIIRHTLILLAFILLPSCAYTKPQMDEKAVTQIVAEQIDHYAQTIKTKQVTNDPTSINILAYLLGGAVLISSLAQAWYNRERIKNVFRNSG